METVRHREIYPIRKYLLIIILLSLMALSGVEHKEFRFVSVLLPLCLYITADTLTRWSYKASRFVKVYINNFCNNYNRILINLIFVEYRYGLLLVSS